MRSTRPCEFVPPGERTLDNIVSWQGFNGGVVHRCMSMPMGSVQIPPTGREVPVYGFVNAELVVLQGEEAEEWELLERSASPEQEG